MQNYPACKELIYLTLSCHCIRVHTRQGNVREFFFFKVRELSGNFMLCQGKMNVFKNVREMSGNFTIYNLKQMMRNRKKARTVF